MIKRKTVCAIRYERYIKGWVQLSKDMYIFYDEGRERQVLHRFNPEVDRKIVPVARNFRKLCEDRDIKYETTISFGSMQNF